MVENEQAKSSEEESIKKPMSCLGVRHVQFLLLASATIVGYGMRAILSVAIVAMTEKEPPDSHIPTYPEWDNKNIIESAFFWGYVIPQIGAGQLAKLYGPKWFLAITMLISSLATALTPVAAATMGSYGVMGCRVIEGLSQGFLFPSIHNLLGKWTPFTERSRVGSFVYVGGPFGTMLSMPITGFIADSAAGWPVAFYLYGVLGTLWFILYAFLGSNSPDEHSSISEEEKDYIQYGMARTLTKKAKTPWKAIFTSLPFISVFVAHSGQNWAFWTLMNGIPSYLAGVMKFNMKNNGLLSALPYLALCLLSIVFSSVSDCLISRKITTVGTARKIFNSIGEFIPAISLFALGFVDGSQRNLAVVLLVLSVGVNAAVYSGFNVNHIDLSPVHAGTLMGITNGLSNIVSIIAPLFMQAILDNHEEDMYRWRTIFCVSAAFYVAGGTFFAIFASGETQSWNNEDDQKKEEEAPSIELLKEAV